MARFFPSQPPDGIERSELLTWRSLEQLDDAWRVFHSVAWQSVRHRRQGDGEADFVLLHPQRGIVVLEVKGGSISIDAGQWFTTPFESTTRRPIKNPFEQATVSKYALLRKLGELQIGRLPSVCHAVVLPNGDVTTDIATYGPREITITELEMLDMPAAIGRVLKHWDASSALTAEETAVVTRLLAPTMTLRSGLRVSMGKAEKALLTLTAEQIRAVGGLRRSRRTAIFGGPGTGKTVLAVHQARTLAEQGGRVLLTCFNEPLAAKLKIELADAPVVVATFHSLCVQRARAAGVSIPSEPSDDWWEREAVAALLEGASPDNAFDAIIIDEAQDFAPDWIPALELLLDDPADGVVTAFADDQQSIYRVGWTPLENAQPYVLDINCRSTLQIVKRVTAVVAGTMSDLGATGPAPLFAPVSDLSDGASTVQDLVARLTEDDHVAPSSISVLCEGRSQVDRLRGLTAGSVALVPPGDIGVMVETIHRFKGLEADACVVWLTGESDDEALRRLAYVGFSRARTFLAVVAPKRLKSTINWA